MVNNLKEAVDANGNVTLSGSLFLNPRVVSALVGTKNITCETVAIGEELRFTLKLGVTKSIHDDAKPAPPAPIQPPKPGTQAPIPATPEKGK